VALAALMGMSAEEPTVNSVLATPLLSPGLASNAGGALQRKAAHLGSVEPPVLTLMHEWLGPLAVTVSLGSAC
jgi:hypothetical protein